MKFYFGQIYIQAGTKFPFSYLFSEWLDEVVTECVEASPHFDKKYPDFRLIIRISAKAGLREPEIRGPSVFRRDKDVEFSVFLPHENKDYFDPAICRDIVRQLLESVIKVLEKLQLDATKVREKIPALLEEFMLRPKFIALQ